LKFQIQQKNDDGSVQGDFTLNQVEATFVLNVGLNYLTAVGAKVAFTGKDKTDEPVIVSGAPAQVQ
jgi:hypothetical protein